MGRATQASIVATVNSFGWRGLVQVSDGGSNDAKAQRFVYQQDVIVGAAADAICTEYCSSQGLYANCNPLIS